jgi:hypothetical protein
MSTCEIRVLLVVGAALELVGIALVAWDVRDARRKVKDMSSPDWLWKQQQQEPEPLGSRSLFALMAQVAAGNVLRRSIGVALFACGAIVQTIANVAAL